MTVHVQQDSKHAFHETSRLNKSYPNLEIRLACVEDGIDNTGFRKISAYIKSIYQNTKIAYIPTSNTRNILNQLLERTDGDFKDKDIHEVAQDTIKLF